MRHETSYLSGQEKGRSYTFLYSSIKALLLSTAVSTVVHAANLPDLSFSGFGTVAYSISDNDDVQFTRGLGGEGADSSLSFKLDSKFGLQMDVDFNDRFSATLQSVVRQDENGEIKPQAEWAYLRAQLNDNFVFRVGRMTDPIFMNSDVREVGYAHQTIRLPEDVYGQSPVASFDGIDLTGHYDFETSSVITRLFAGEKEFYYPGDFRADVDNLYGITVDIEHGFSRWRVGYTHADIALRADFKQQIADAVSQLSTIFPPLQPFADDLQPRRWAVELINFGVELDLAPWLIEAEWLMVDSVARATDTQSWFLIIGRQFNTVTPFVSFSVLDQKEALQVPDPGIPEAAGLISALQGIYEPLDQKTLALGVRWDFAPKLSLKAQLEHIERDNLGNSFIPNDPSVPINNEDVHLLSVGLDFIF